MNAIRSRREYPVERLADSFQVRSRRFSSLTTARLARRMTAYSSVRRIGEAAVVRLALETTWHPRRYEELLKQPWSAIEEAWRKDSVQRFQRTARHDQLTGQYAASLR